MKTIMSNFSYDLKRIAEKKYNATALIVKNGPGFKTISYGELDELVSKCVAYYRNILELNEGSKVVVLLPNSSEMIIAFLASIRAGIGFAPLYCDASSYEIERWVKLISPEIVLTTDFLSEKISEITAEMEVRTSIIKVDGKYSWLKTSNGKDRVAKNSARLFISTSGSTGTPKAMVLNSNLLWSSGISFIKFHNLSNKQLRMWNFLPMSYLGGLYNLALIPLSTGGTILVDEPFSGGTLLHFWQTVERHDINTLWLVPTIVQGLLKFSSRMPEDLLQRIESKVNIALLGTSPISLRDKQKFEDTFGIPLVENYGLSETTFISSEKLNDDSERQEGTVGKPLPYIDVKLNKIPNGSDEGNNEYEEIWVRTPYLFDGYLNENGEVELNVDEEGYFKTSDIGTLTDNNQLILAGRVRDVVKKGGLLVSLSEVERIATDCKLVKEAAAVKISHDFYGESYNLYVIPNGEDYEREKPILNEIEVYIHNTLTKYKWPENIHLMESFPRTQTGKVKKHLI